MVSFHGFAYHQFNRSWAVRNCHQYVFSPQALIRIVKENMYHITEKTRVEGICFESGSAVEIEKSEGDLLGEGPSSNIRSSPNV